MLQFKILTLQAENCHLALPAFTMEQITLLCKVPTFGICFKQ